MRRSKAVSALSLLAGASLSRIFYDPVGARVANIVFAAALVVTTVFAFV